MLKYCAILLFLSLSNLIKGQDIYFNRWAIGLNVSPDLCYRTLVKTEQNPTLDFLVKVRNDEEVIRPGYTAGLIVRYNLRHDLFLESGFQYATKGEKTINKKVFSLQPGPDLPNYVKFKYYYNYAELPLKINKVFIRGSNAYYFSAGIITGYMLDAGVITKSTYSDGHTEKKKQPNTYYEYNKISFSPALGIGLTRIINERLVLKFGPEFRHGAHTIINAPLKGYLWSFGFNFGCYMNL